MDCVFLLHALAAITTVLRAPVTDQEHYLGLGGLILQLGCGMPDGSAHTRRVERSDFIYPLFHFVTEAFFNVLDDVELHVLPAVALETIDSVSVTDVL